MQVSVASDPFGPARTPFFDWLASVDPGAGNVSESPVHSLLAKSGLFLLSRCCRKRKQQISSRQVIPYAGLWREQLVWIRGTSCVEKASEQPSAH